MKTKQKYNHRIMSNVFTLYAKGGPRNRRRRIDSRFGTSETCIDDVKEASRQRISDDGWDQD